MRETTRRFLAGLLAIALVSTAVAPVGTASAEGDFASDCTNVEKVAIGVTFGLAEHVIDCIDDGIDVDEMNENQAHQTHADLYQGFRGATEQKEILTDTQKNLNAGLKSVRRMEGKNAFIRSLSETSSKAESITAGQRAVLDNYSATQAQIARSFEARARQIEDIASKADSEQNLTSADVLRFNTTQGDPGGIAVVNVQDTTVTLANESTFDTKEIVMENSGGAGHTYDVTNEGEGSVSGGPLASVDVVPPEQLDASASLSAFTGDYSSQWTELETQADEVAGNIESFANETYSAWDAGIISRADLVDPYLGARNYEPNASGGSTWTVRSLAALGISPPENASNVQTMTVRDERTQTLINGTLMSDSTPENGFTVGETYNASKLGGPQYVVTGDGSFEPLENEFTLVSADGFEDRDYEKGDVIGYPDPTTTRTTNLSEYAALSERLRNLTEQLEARERKIESENISSGGGGALFDFDSLGASLPFGGAGVVVAIGAVVVLGLVTRN